MRPHRASLLVVCTLAFVPEAWGEIRYVSTKGKDNAACAQATPCRTISHAVGVASPGDTVSIGPGKFHEPFGVLIAKNLTLEGAGIFSTRVDGVWEGYSIFEIQVGAAVTITNLDVMGGRAQNGGGILNHGQLYVDRVRIRNNSADAGGGVFNWSGALLSMSRTEIALNHAEYAGGLLNHGIALLREVHVVANHADLQGGIVNQHTQSGPAALLAERSLVSHNSGIGVFNLDRLVLVNTTVSRNGALGVFTAQAGYTTLTHVTVADNGHGPGHDPTAFARGGVERVQAAEVELINTIVANNAGGDCHGGAFDAVNSLAGDYSCFSPGFGNLVADPRLEPLKWSNLGNTRVHALKADSPAIDAAAPGSCEAVDQRGVTRPVDGDLDSDPQCDIGAFEYVPDIVDM